MPQMSPEIRRLNAVLDHVDRKRKGYKTTWEHLNSERFQDAWDAATHDQKMKVLEEAEAGNYQEVRNWIKKLLAKSLHDMHILQLRALATRLGIKGCSRYPKDQLVRAIEKKGYTNVEEIETEESVAGGV